MRILVVAPFYTPEGGGLERYAHEIGRRLAAGGHEVHALAFTRGAPGRTVHDGVHVERRGALMQLGNAPIHPAFGAVVRRRIEEFRPDLVVAHTPVPFPAETAYAAARRADVPFVTTYHSGTLRGSTRALHMLASIDRRTLERRMLGGSSRLVAVSPYVRDHALSRVRERVALVPPGVDHAMFAPNGPPDGPGILFVGPLSHAYRWKGVDVLFDAYEELRRDVPDARLTLVGDGDRTAELVRRALPHRGAVRVLPRMTDDDLVDAYRRAAVTVLPSTTDAESFGMVLAEANACARPVVGSDVGGIPDFVRDGANGLLARPGDAADLADKIRCVLDDPHAARRMGMRGRARVVEQHDWDDLAGRTLHVLEEATA